MLFFLLIFTICINFLILLLKALYYCVHSNMFILINEVQFKFHLCNKNLGECFKLFKKQGLIMDYVFFLCKC